MTFYNTFVTYNGNGTTTDFSVPFSYLDQDEVIVTFTGLTAYTYSFVSPNVIRTSPALAVGDTVRIDRDTDIASAKVVFANGAPVTGGQLNSAINQLIYSLQESSDISDSLDDIAQEAVSASANATSAAAEATAAAALAAAAVEDIGALTIGDGTVTTAKLANSAVTTVKVADAAITEAKIANDAVATAKIPDGAVTTAKIPDSGITNAKIANNAVTTSKIADGAISAAKMAEGSASFRSVPQNAKTASYTLLASDNGKHISITTGGVTVPSGVFAEGDTVTIYNNSSAAQTIIQGGSVTMFLVGTATTGNRTLAQRGLATILCVASNTFVITGGGLT